MFLECIEGKAYVIALHKEICLLSDDFKGKEIIFYDKEKKEARFVTFSGYLCVYFKGAKEILIFKGK